MRLQTLLPRCNVAAMVTLQPAMFLNRTPEQIEAQVGGAYEIIARDLPLPYVDAMVQVCNSPGTQMPFKNPNAFISITHAEQEQAATYSMVLWLAHMPWPHLTVCSISHVLTAPREWSVCGTCRSGRPSCSLTYGACRKPSRS